MPRLVCLSGMNKGEEYELPEQGEITIGRSEKNDICVFDKKSSRHHCKIFIDGDAMVLEDLNSTNGIKVNNALVAGQRNLAVGDHIAIGQTVFLISEGLGAKPDEGGSSTLLKKQKKYENLLQKTSFQVTKTTALRKMRADKEGGDTGFLSFFETDAQE